MNNTAPAGFGRFQKHVILGALMSGIASGIPLLGALNCCFCILNMAGIAFALSLYLKSNPGDVLTQGEAALFGAAAGAGAGLITGILGLVTNLLFSSVIAQWSEQLPEASRKILASSGAWGVLAIPMNIVLYGAFGALGGFLALQFFFKTRIKPK